MQFQSVFYGAGLILRLGSFTAKAALNSDGMKVSCSMVPPRNIIIMGPLFVFKQMRCTCHFCETWNHFSLYLTGILDTSKGLEHFVFWQLCIYQRRKILPTSPTWRHRLDFNNKISSTEG